MPKKPTNQNMTMNIHQKFRVQQSHINKASHRDTKLSKRAKKHSVAAIEMAFDSDDDQVN